MSGYYNKRDENKPNNFNTFNHALDLRLTITELLLRDFGLKVKKENILKLKNSSISEEDNAIIESLFDKYRYEPVCESEFPSWFVENNRKVLMNLCNDLISHISHANSIYPVYKSEYFQRRNLQNLAIGDCENILQEFTYAIDILPLDINKFMPIVDMIEKQIALLKGWRKSDASLLEKTKDLDQK